MYDFDTVIFSMSEYFVAYQLIRARAICFGEKIPTVTETASV